MSKVSSNPEYLSVPCATTSPREADTISDERVFLDFCLKYAYFEHIVNGRTVRGHNIKEAAFRGWRPSLR